MQEAPVHSLFPQKTQEDFIQQEFPSNIFKLCYNIKK